MFWKGLFYSSVQPHENGSWCAAYFLHIIFTVQYTHIGAAILDFDAVTQFLKKNLSYTRNGSQYFIYFSSYARNMHRWMDDVFNFPVLLRNKWQNDYKIN